MEKLEVVEGKVDWKGRLAYKHKHGGTRSSLLILVAFGFESMANFALAVNLITYFNSVMHFELADAANQLTNYMGTGYILSILMAILPDTYFGRVKTVIISSCFEFLALILLMIQAHYPNLKPPPCNMFDKQSHCETVEGKSAAMLYVALYILAIGNAGIKAALPSHGADQFDEKDPKEAMQMSSFFNKLLLGLCLGGAVSLTLIVWIQDYKGWDWGLGVSSAAMFFSVVIFVAGLPLYRMHIVSGSSTILQILQVYVAAIRNRKLILPEDSTQLYEIERDKEVAAEDDFLPHRNIYRFLDKAAIQETPSRQVENPEASSAWKLCTVTQVENAKIVLSMVPIFCCTIIMTLCLAQLQTFSIQQGLTMDTKLTNSFSIPPASLPIIPVSFIILIVPIYDKIFVPFARKLTGIPTGITHLQRVGVGLVLSSISMAVAALVEVKRKGVARDHNMLDATPVSQPLPISTFWLSFQFFIFGIADLFTYVGLLEFFYSEAPKALKSVSTCFLWSSMALGYFLSTIVVKIVNRATEGITRSGGWLIGNNINRNHLNLFYWMLSILSMINFFIYIFVAKKYKYRNHKPGISKAVNDSRTP
ncbi:protein NRT1/ PTR FAMILY 4.5-like isoform X2 [Cucumis melo var. makuwa]|uniref:Protein NRT1/ PTR FAMILY 4.5-like isoform X2 n=1 Tax=Cucumis melo var. makuwa TaxID=1194695 RepID=A0A5A7UA16_CUCMM|nr:protein NRT1/ PTR FAMILY 4.5-like isoform X2 [Cucumis melo var. makuwa]